MKISDPRVITVLYGIVKSPKSVAEIARDLHADEAIVLDAVVLLHSLGLITPAHGDPFVRKNRLSGTGLEKQEIIDEALR